MAEVFQLNKLEHFPPMHDVFSHRNELGYRGPEAMFAMFYIMVTAEAHVEEDILAIQNIYGNRNFCLR
jgi:hypothetical protein